MARMTGVVFKMRLNKGYAFIRGEDGHSRFMHARDVRPTTDFDKMYEGQKVTFEPEGTLDTDPDSKHNGLSAVKVTVE